MSALIDNLEKLLADGQDNALLRYSLGNAYLAASPDIAVKHLREAVRLDGDYSAAWKALGKAFTASGRLEEAQSAYREGIEVAERKGDIQAAKEMRVFLKRLASD